MMSKMFLCYHKNSLFNEKYKYLFSDTYKLLKRYFYIRPEEIGCTGFNRKYKIK